MKKILSLVTIFALLLALSASAFAADTDTVFKVGICNYVDDASLNQIVENIVNQLETNSTPSAKKSPSPLTSAMTTATPTPTSWLRLSRTSSPTTST